MILVELEIEDYKQFAGLHRFTPSPEGVIAVIGQNGAGKTTLFEAIEWCLYQPREIVADEVPPRGKVAKPRVQLTLLDPDTDTRYVVVRTLNKNKVADAEIYRADDLNSRIVKGSRQVTEHVAKTLIGLSHRAFVSTFFTRQKELTFFGDMKETERRREVGRLLGMETIREAQKLIGEERGERQNQAKVLGIQGREASEGRDFAAEAAEAEQRVAERAALVAAAEEALAKAEACHASARAEVERLAALEREDSALRANLARIDGDIRAAEARRDAAKAELGRMSAAAAERATLAGIAAELESRRLAVQALDLARERHQSVQRLQTDLDRARKSLQGVVRDLESAVKSAGSIGVEGWSWRPEDASSPALAARRLIDAASTIDLEATAAEADAFLKAEKFAQDLEQARAQAAQFRAHMQRLQKELAELTAAGDPHCRRDAAMEQRQAALREIDRAASRITAIREEIERLEPVLQRLRAQEDGAICPTCARPFDAADAAITIGLFSSTIQSLTDEQNELATARDAAAQSAARLDAEIKDLTELAKQVDVLSGRIQSGEQKIADADQGAIDIELALRTHLETHGLAQLPSADEIEAAKRRLEVARRVGGVMPLLARLEQTARQAAEDESAIVAELAQLGDSTYDPKAHEAARAALKEAETAAARIAQIDSLLAQRPEREAEIAAAEAELASCQEQRATQLAARAALGFDPAALQQAQEAERAAMQAERDAREERAAAVAAHADATKSRDALLAEHQRIAKLIERADACAREADLLDLMYREFNGFEQYVADRLTPQLSDYTSELLAAITEGKYDHVWFNSNYGLEVYDGAEERFPVEEFSGGERDVIALCARLALSRLIGSQANNPPGFMVLDEVFGSLDRERRAQVLETLGALAGTAGAFHQLFIISHVDDVRSSPIFNEVWRVTEGPDGVSHLENLNLTGGFEDA